MDPWEQAAKEYKTTNTPSPGGAPPVQANEDWKLWQQHMTNGDASGSALERGAGSYWDEIKHGPANLLALGNAILHPVNTLQGMKEANDVLAGRASEAFKSGQVGEGLRHSMNFLLNTVPGLGSSLDVAGTKGEQGDVAGMLGTTAGAATNAYLGAKTPQIMRGAANLPETVRGAFRVDPSIAMVRALRPTPSDSGFVERLPDTLANIKKAAGKDITSDEELIPAAKTAITNHQQALESWMTNARTQGAKAIGDPIADAGIRSLPDTMMLENPAQAQSIAQQINAAYRGRQFSVDELRSLLAEKNAELDSFYGKAEGKQSAAVTSGAPQAVVKAQRDAIADTLYKTLDPQGGGMSPRLIQRQTGDMIDILDAAQRRRNAIIAEKPASTAEMVGRGVSKYASLPLRTFTGKPFGTASLPFGAPGEAEIAAGTSDPLIRKAFQAVGEPNAIPQPIPGWQQAAQGIAPKQLKPAPMQPAQTASYVRGVPAMPQPPNPGRALPAAPTIRTAGPIPDTSSVRGVPAEPPYQTRQLPPAAPGAAPTTVQPPGPPGTAWRMPAAGSYDAFGRPQPLALPPPQPLNPQDVVVRLGQAPGEPLPAENVKLIPRPPGMAKGGVVTKGKHTAGSVEDRVRGSANVPLSDEGRQEALKIGQILAQRGFGKHGDAIVPSALSRAQETGSLIQKSAPQARMMPPSTALDTWSTGLEGMPTEQANKILKQMIDNPDMPPPQQSTLSSYPPETANQFRLRFLGKGIKPLMAEYLRAPNRKIVPIIHGRGIRLLKGWVAKGMPDDLSVDWKYMREEGDKPGEAYRFAPGAGGKWKLTDIDWNKTARLRQGILPVRHAQTVFNTQDAPKALMNGLPVVKPPS